MQGEELKKETIKAIQALRKDGVSVRKTALMLGVSKGSVERHGPVDTSQLIAVKTKKDRDDKLEKIIDLSGERLVEVLESKEKIGPVALNTVMGTAWDKRYGKEHTSAQSPAHVLIQLFGRSGVGEKIARNLTAMIPDVKVIESPASDTTVIEGEVIDATAVDVTDDEKDTTPGPGITQEE